MEKKKILLYSRLAFYPMHWQAFRMICEDNNVEASVITTDYADLPDGHKMLGWADPEREKKTGFVPKIYYIPRKNFLTKTFLIFKYLHEARPDVIWAQEEPVNTFIIPLLVFYFFKKKPLIVVAITENIFPMKGIRKIFYTTLWKRLGGILSVAPMSTKGIRAAGMPMSVPTYDFVAGCLSPGEDRTVADMPLRKSPEDFIVGYVGRLAEEKGWKVAVETIRQAPAHFKLAIAGNGDQIGQLNALLDDPALKDKLYYAGLLPKEKLWQFYRALDCLTVPSLTTPWWKEQFGGILADAMAVGLPIIGSTSGAIPEVTGPAGIIVTENDTRAMFEGLKKLKEDLELRKKLGEEGKKRFEEEFSIKTYARKISVALHLNQTK